MTSELLQAYEVFSEYDTRVEGQYYFRQRRFEHDYNLILPDTPKCHQTEFFPHLSFLLDYRFCPNDESTGVPIIHMTAYGTTLHVMYAVEDGKLKRGFLHEFCD